MKGLKRIEAKSRVSLATMALTLILASISPASAQRASPAPGDTVRVKEGLPIRGGRAADFTGVLADEQGDTLTLRSLDGGRVMEVFRGPNSEVLVRNGEQSFGPWKGAFFGAGVLGLASLLYDEKCTTVDISVSGSPIYRCERDRPTGEAILVGAMAGGIFGQLLKIDRWIPVDTGPVGVSVSGSQSSLFASLRFNF